MITKLEIQIAGNQKEINAVNDFLMLSENQGKTFHAGTEVYYVGIPSPIPTDTGMLLLEQGFAEIRNTFMKNI